MDKQEPRELRTIQCDRQMSAVRFSPCGHWLVAGGYDASLRWWDLSGDEPQEQQPLEGHHGWVTAMRFVPGADPPLLVSADSWGQLRATSFDERPAEVWSQGQAHDGWIRALSLGADGRLVATGGRDRTAQVWAAADGSRVAELADHPQEVYAVAVAPDGKSLVTGDLLGVLRHWDLESEKLVAERKIENMHLYERIQDVGGLRLLAFQDDRTLICAGAEPQKAGRSIAIPTMHWLDWPSLEVRRTVRFGPEKQGFVFDFAWHPAGYHVAVSSGQPGNGQFLLLRPDADAPFFLTTKMSNCHSADVHPDGRIVVAASNRNSQGNGAVTDKDGKYLGNFSPLHLFAPPAADAEGAGEGEGE